MLLVRVSHKLDAISDEHICHPSSTCWWLTIEHVSPPSSMVEERDFRLAQYISGLDLDLAVPAHALMACSEKWVFSQVENSKILRRGCKHVVEERASSGSISAAEGIRERFKVKMLLQFLRAPHRFVDASRNTESSDKVLRSGIDEDGLGELWNGENDARCVQ